MQKKSDATVVSSMGDLKFAGQAALHTIMSQLPPIPDYFVGRRMEQYNWYEKTMLVMLEVKEIDYNLHELFSVFYAIRGNEDCILDLGEIIYILDEFSRRLDAIDLSINTVTEIALISAIVGLKAASDTAIWNVDLVNEYNSCITLASRCKTIDVSDIAKLEKQHLESLNYQIGFNHKSNMNERFQKIMKFIDLEAIHIMERELQALGCSDDGVILGGVVQQAIFKKTSEMPLGFFRKGCTQSKDEDNISCEERKEVSVPKNPLRQSI